MNEERQFSKDILRQIIITVIAVLINCGGGVLATRFHFLSGVIPWGLFLRPIFLGLSAVPLSVPVPISSQVLFPAHSVFISLQVLQLV